MTIYDKSYTVEIKQTYLLSLHKKFILKQHINKLSVEISSFGLIDMFALIHTTYIMYKEHLRVLQIQFSDAADVHIDWCFTTMHISYN